MSRLKRNLGFRLAVGWLVLVALLAILYPWLPFVDDPAFNDLESLGEGPSPDHWFGTTTLGRDVFAQVLAGARISLRIALIATAVGIVAGGLLGMLAGYFKGWVDTIITLAVNAMLSVPALVLVSFIVTIRDPTVTVITFAIILLAIPALTRIVRASTLQVSEREFVKAAEVMGAKNVRILIREVLPNVLPAMLSFAFLTTGLILVAESSLSFLGLGVKQPSFTWGNIILEGRSNMRETAHMVLLPALVLFLTVLSLNFVGDQLLKRFDIKEAAI